MKKSRVIPAIVALTAAAVLVPSAAALAAPGSAAHLSSPARAARPATAFSAKVPRVPTNCSPGYFCSYNTTNGTSPCFRQRSNVTYYTWATSCAKKDESLNNNIAQPNYPGLTRVYYSAGQQGAFMCMDAGDYLDDVSIGHNNGAYKFDQGPSGKNSGYDQSIWHNIASDEIDMTASCVTNE